jgi:hypothetical protein
VLGSLATNAAAVPIFEDSDIERVNRPMNWIIGLKLFLTSCNAAIFSDGRSNPSPSMSTQTTIRQSRLLSAFITALRLAGVSLW